MLWRPNIAAPYSGGITKGWLRCYLVNRARNKVDSKAALSLSRIAIRTFAYSTEVTVLQALFRIHCREVAREVLILICVLLIVTRLEAFKSSTGSSRHRLL